MKIEDFREWFRDRLEAIPREEIVARLAEIEATAEASNSPCVIISGQILVSEGTLTLSGGAHPDDFQRTEWDSQFSDVSIQKPAFLYSGEALECAADSNELALAA